MLRAKSCADACLAWRVLRENAGLIEAIGRMDSRFARAAILARRTLDALRWESTFENGVPERKFDERTPELAENREALSVTAPKSAILGAQPPL
jgi:hypothetical protein